MRKDKEETESSLREKDLCAAEAQQAVKRTSCARSQRALHNARRTPQAQYAREGCHRLASSQSSTAEEAQRAERTHEDAVVKLRGHVVLEETSIDRRQAVDLGWNPVASHLRERIVYQPWCKKSSVKKSGTQ